VLEYLIKCSNIILTELGIFITEFFFVNLVFKLNGSSFKDLEDDSFWFFFKEDIAEAK
jgi:hypothetical protein